MKFYFLPSIFKLVEYRVTVHTKQFCKQKSGFSIREECEIADCISNSKLCDYCKGKFIPTELFQIFEVPFNQPDILIKLFLFFPIHLPVELRLKIIISNCRPQIFFSNEKIEL